MEVRRQSDTDQGLPNTVRPQVPTPTFQSFHPSTPLRPSSPASMRSIPPHVGLPYLRAEANISASSLMEAVIGPEHAHSQAPQPPSSYAQPASMPPARRIDPTATAGSSSNSPLKSGSHSASGSGSGSSNSHGDGSLVKVENQSSEWEVLSDASAKVNEGNEGESDEVVKELQEKVDKRRSLLPHLESQLAALEAQIKAAEERLAQVQTNDAVPTIDTANSGATAQA